jgi:hypothetical protein
MKFPRITIFNILFLVFVIWQEAIAIAQAKIVVTPNAITIHATRGETVTRTLAIRADGAIAQYGSSSSSNKCFSSSSSRISALPGRFVLPSWGMVYVP